MRFDDRSYVDIVRDLLTQMTEGVAGEPVLVPVLGDGTVPERYELRHRPIRRISHVMGTIAGAEPDSEVEHRFTEREFELLPSESDPAVYVGLRLRPRAPRPIPGSYLVVNYYPLRTTKSPITDVNVGSVARTLVETVAREMATQYVQLQRVYDSAFVETSTGRSLDKVGALVDTKRIGRGHAIGKVRFSRRQGAAGTIHVPAKTALTDGQGTRYLTSEDALLEPTQSTVEVWVHGERSGTPVVAAGELSVIERAIAGIDRVQNDEATWAASSEERDDAYAQRARKAIHAAGKGTLDAIRFGLEGLPFVSGVTLGEYDGSASSPVPMPGMLRVDVALTQDNALNRALVDKRIRELRPAGIWIDRGFAEPIELSFEAGLTLAGARLEDSEVQSVKEGVRARLGALVEALGPGQSVRAARLVSAVLQDERIADVSVALRAGGQAITEAVWTIPAGKAAQAAAQLVDFLPPSYEDQADTSSTTLIYVDIDVKVQSFSIATAQIEAGVKPAVEALLGGLGPNAQLTFDQLLTALRDPREQRPDEVERWVVDRTQTVVALEREGGGFQELGRAEVYTLAPATTLVLRQLAVEGPAT